MPQEIKCTLDKIAISKKGASIVLSSEDVTEFADCNVMIDEPVIITIRLAQEELPLDDAKSKK